MKFENQIENVIYHNRGSSLNALVHILQQQDSGGGGGGGGGAVFSHVPSAELPRKAGYSTKGCSKVYLLIHEIESITVIEFVSNIHLCDIAAGMQFLFSFGNDEASHIV